MSGTSPQCVSRIAKRVVGAAIRMSAPDMIWKPPPNATPWTAAITGIGNIRQPHVTCCGKIAPSALRPRADRSEEHTSELQSLMRISYAVFCLKKKKTTHNNTNKQTQPQQNKL